MERHDDTRTFHSAEEITELYDRVRSAYENGYYAEDFTPEEEKEMLRCDDPDISRMWHSINLYYMTDRLRQEEDEQHARLRRRAKTALRHGLSWNKRPK